MATFILLILGLFGFIHLKHRVRILEERLDGKGIVKAAQEAAVTPSIAPSPLPAPTPSLDKHPESQEEKSARWLGWIGAIMLLLGVSFFLKYAFDHWIGPRGQVSIGIVGGLLLIALGQKLQATYRRYSGMLFGAGIGILYLAIYAGFAFYHPGVIAQPVAFALMILVTALAMVIAVMNKTVELGILGTLGGFLTPVFLSTGTNELVILSCYMIVLNVAVLGVAWFTRWTKLNYLAFFGTVLLFGGWMSRFYFRDPDGQLTATFLFLTIFFLLFLSTSILHHVVRRERSSSSELLLLVLNAMGYFGVCYFILEPRYDAFLGFFALVLALVYFAVSYFSYARNIEDRTLNLTLPGIAIVFLSLAIPLQLTGYWIAVAWLVESMVLVYVGLSIKEKPMQIFGWLVLLAGMVSMMNEVMHIRSEGLNDIYAMPLMQGLTPVFNTGFALLLLGVATLLVLARLYAQFRTPEREWGHIAATFLLLANMLFIYAFSTEVSQKFDQDIAAINHKAELEVERAPEYAGIGEPYPYALRIYDAYPAIDALHNKSNTMISVLWAFYAILLLVVGFLRRIRVIRIFGLVFFFVTALKVVVDVWSLGQIYRIVSTIVFGVIALAAAFLYVKYKSRLNEIMHTVEVDK